MIRIWAIIVGLGGFLSVGAGALAAHRAGNPHQAELLRTGALYGMVHAAALFGVIALAERRARPGLVLALAGWGFALGIVLFSFSLFAVALTGMQGLARVTPFGGVALMVGWAAIAIGAFARRAR